MSVNAAVQHLAAGAATWLGGLMLHQASHHAPLVGYPIVGVVSCAASVVSLVLVGQLRIAPSGDAAPDSALIAEAVAS